MTTAVEMININKSFPGVQANDDISFNVERGEIHGLLGENGSGKTTLMNVLFGLYQPDSGKIKINGQEVIVKGPGTAIELGIEMIHQHFMLVKNFTVAENIILGDEPSNRFKILKRKQIFQEVSSLLDQVGFQLDPNSLIEDISVGLQQRVEILKALYRRANILILDEPTSVLTPQEVEELFETMTRLKQQGVTIIFITHKLKEIISICDRVTVLRHGKVIDSVNIPETNTSELASMMVGREIIFNLDKKPSKPGKTVLKVENISTFDDRGFKALIDVSFSVKEGEIVGIAGVQGNGQSELVEALTGLRTSSEGSIQINGITTTNLTPKEIFNAGVAHIPEDRQKRGLILSFSIKDNMILGIHDYPDLSRLFLLDNKKITQFNNKCKESFEIKLVDLDMPIQTLSGGNQQKVILARELLGRKLKLIIAAQPTRGLDVGVIEYVHETLLRMRDEGKAILLVSSELDEIRTLADRAFVMYKGKIMAEVDPVTISDREISLLMAGIELTSEER